ncbi:hypothetical protein BRC86_11375 [Halobacteriales archaeon QS_3_64_16]|nr:MAG: hypothetical protein BRC86_11375 [Halobacteriales archaeon QS_3_64_16]
MNQSFDALADGRGVGVSDPIERRQYELHTPDSVEPRRVPTDRFAFPVDDAVSIETERLSLPQVVAAYVRDGDGEMVAEAEHYADISLPAGQYSVELCTPIKLYLRVESALEVSADTAEMTLVFDPGTTVLIGSRSHHEHPAATITTTDDPLDVMTAVSYLGSALKTTSCERSYPTLRGHPPTIEVGEELEIPPELERPETGIRIEVPTDLPSIFVVAPLAYYLGAEVVSGSVPRIRTDSGLEYVLDGPDGFEAEVERTLKQVFFLDCLTRTEGLYKVDLHERRAVASVLDLDFGDLYGERLAEQLEAYLEVPFALLEEHVPQWKLTTYVAPEIGNAEMLPFVVNDLAVVKTPGSMTDAESSSGTQARAVEEFVRSDASESMRAGAFTRSASGATEDTSTGSAPGVGAESGVDTPSPAPASSSGPAQRSSSETLPETPSIVELEESDSLEQAWVGEDVPLGASKATATAFRNKLDREATDGDIAITVICNDEEMLDEHDDVAEVYGNREELPFDVRMYRDLSTDQLRFVLESETDFLHYIGHIDERGFECTDGMLDVADLDSVGVDTFLLNACRSYRQGMKLIDRGAIAGVVTLEDILDSGALRIGRAMARLLNRGFPMRAALNIASGQSIIGNQYLVVGYGNMDVTQAESGTPAIFEIESNADDMEVRFQTYPTTNRGIGSMICPQIEGNNNHFLSCGMVGPFTMAKDDIKKFLSLEVGPVRVNGEFTWSDRVATTKL